MKKAPKKSGGEASEVIAYLAHNVRELRTRRELSQEALAELAGFHRTYVSQVERGISNVSIESLARLARVLGVEASRLIRKPRESVNEIDDAGPE